MKVIAILVFNNISYTEQSTTGQWNTSLVDSWILEWASRDLLVFNFLSHFEQS